MTLRTLSVFIGIICSIQALSCSKEGDSEGPQPTILVFDNSQAEGKTDNVLSFKISLDVASTREVRISCETQNGTAISGEDYTGVGTTEIVFAPGETKKFVDISIHGDSDKEADESFTITLKNPVNATLNRNSALITLLNDDQLAPASGYTTPLSYPGLSLVWNDEFNGTSLDLGTWTPETSNGNGGWGNNELQFYRAENTSVQDGNLIIEARAEAFSGFNYTSSRLITKGKKEFKFGRIDIRAALPEGQGIWPALWMLGDDIDQVGWPACGEIDIMELVGHEPGRVHGTAHYGADFTQHQYKGAYFDLPAPAKFSQEFHVFTIIWEENKIRWFVDDVPFYEITPAITNPQPYPFNHEHFFIFNVAVGGNWPGSPNATTVFPQRMFVDYVRVFQ